MFWLSYECFSISCDAFLLKSVIFSHNSCEQLQQKLIQVFLAYKPQDQDEFYKNVSY